MYYVVAITIFLYTRLVHVTTVSHALTFTKIFYQSLYAQYRQVAIQLQLHEHFGSRPSPHHELRKTDLNFKTSVKSERGEISLARGRQSYQQTLPDAKRFRNPQRIYRYIDNTYHESSIINITFVTKTNDCQQ